MVSISLIFLVSAIAVASAKAPMATPVTPATPDAVTDKSHFSTNSRIFNGTTAAVGQFPHQVSLRNMHDNKHFCGGSLIAHKWILTVATCLDQYPTRAIVAVVGTIEPSTSGSKYKIQLKRRHPYYQNPNRVKYNIALLRTVDTVVFNEFVRPIALPSHDVPANTSVIISGWGRISRWNATLPKQLKYVHSATISNIKCEKYASGVGETTICVIGDNGSMCKGDEGG